MQFILRSTTKPCVSHSVNITCSQSVISVSTMSTTNQRCACYWLNSYLLLLFTLSVQSISQVTISKHVVKSFGEMAPPCLTPFLVGTIIGGDSKATFAKHLEFVSQNSLMYCTSIPYFPTDFKTAFILVLSKIFLQSAKVICR